jgi:hypothetical protein
MKNLIKDIYVIFWKHFQRQSMGDENFMAASACVLSVVFLLLNINRCIAFLLGKNLLGLLGSSKIEPLIVCGLILVLGVKCLKIALRHCPELQNNEGITSRYDKISSVREGIILIFSIANPVVLLFYNKI